MRPPTNGIFPQSCEHCPAVLTDIIEPDTPRHRVPTEVFHDSLMRELVFNRFLMFPASPALKYQKCIPTRKVMFF